MIPKYSETNQFETVASNNSVFSSITQYNHLLYLFCKYNCVILPHLFFVAAATNFTLLWNLKIHGKVTAVSTSVDGSLVAVALIANDDYPLEKFGDGRNFLDDSKYLIGERASMGDEHPLNLRAIA